MFELHGPLPVQTVNHKYRWIAFFLRLKITVHAIFKRITDGIV